MEETNLKPAESLSIIHNMINTAKHRLADDGFLLILWGWLIFTAAISHYISLVTAIPNGHWAWNILIPLGALISLLYGLRRKKKDKVSTYTEVYLSYSWGAFLIAMMLTLVFMSVHGLRSTYFFLMLLYGIATFVSGGLLHFSPLLVGSLFSFLFAIVSVFLEDRELFLCLAASLLFSYIIPGHLLQLRFRSQNNV